MLYKKKREYGNMLKVTEDAKKELANILKSENIGDKKIGLRLVPKGSGNLGFIADKQKDGDEIIGLEGLNVLMIEPEAL